VEKDPEGIQGAQGHIYIYIYRYYNYIYIYILTHAGVLLEQLAARLRLDVRREALVRQAWVEADRTAASKDPPRDVVQLL